MPSWMIHFNIAEYLTGKFVELNTDAFIVGNIGPDCSQRDVTTSQLSPHTNITHFTRTGRKLDIDIEGFYTRYLQSSNDNDEAFLFYLGYYVHLFTDLKWTEQIWLPIKEKHKDEISSLNTFLNEVKNEWNIHDQQLFQNNPGIPAFVLFCSLNVFENKYLDFYGNDAFSDSIKSIREHYLICDNKCDRKKDEEYRYYIPEEGELFVSRCASEIYKIITQKEELCSRIHNINSGFIR